MIIGFVPGKLPKRTGVPAVDRQLWKMYSGHLQRAKQESKECFNYGLICFFVVAVIAAVSFFGSGILLVLAERI